MSVTLETFTDIAAAAAALAAPGAAYLGGGSLLVRRANEGDVALTHYVRLADPALRAIEVCPGRVRIGAGVTMGEILRHPGLDFLGTAARLIGGPAIRNAATVGGNLYARAPYGDFAVALLALDAVVHLGGRSGERDVPVEDFLAKRGTAFAKAIVTAVSFAVPANGTFRFIKASRVRPKGLSVVTIAAVLDTRGGLISFARIALGCLADRPMRARAAETALIGRAQTPEGIAPALALALEGTTPITDAVASGWYRGAVLPVHLGRLLLADA
ncbi:FAD binding domain-containing protein [Chelatococcus asaccharovorans]|uniref:CO/xanthine dehydrogenase FAD-binding subunit n=1 Tax=Chelatococcus asaccharovorans TaxID=28210 RepID=A0A2V3UG84_9HYPH|nr:FAD binding domain-containing protein [Chelatococcus asaccharovorans]MBS7701927.1 FAD binding domain-containing protein [Chelatococcus asaccharovorans]PXW64365.1 CO/xanthine dehydrogenase FAD-binding subunit [Chelatococcus asaccharovorans]